MEMKRCFQHKTCVVIDYDWFYVVVIKTWHRDAKK